MPFKRIFHLVIAMTLLISEICKANDEAEDKDLKWATELGNNSTKMVWEHLQEQFKEQESMDADQVLKIGEQVSSRQFAGLYVFVSSSMPKSLFKSYMEESKKYGGVLVFKGLPNGSFKELILLIRELTEEEGGEQEQLPSMQIDDEAFDKFNVTLVPSILLVGESGYAPNQTLNVIYDKISGNVPIKYALEQFADSGHLSKQAQGILYESK